MEWERGSRSWRAMPVAAGSVRLAVAVVPVAASAFASLLAGHLLARLPGAFGFIVWLFGMVAVGTGVLLVTERLARRFAPLAMLLKLSLVFPGEAPRRFGLALKAHPTKELERRARSGCVGKDAADDAAVAASILLLLARLSAHDRSTRGHCERVRAFTEIIGEELRLPNADREKLRWAAVLHDIGKLGVPSNVLNKPGRPTESEWEILKAHPEIGAQIVRPMEPFLGGWAHVVAEHHERWDGNGYPRGIAGREISFGARIVAVADSYEAMTAARSYSKPMPAAAARRELVSNSGAQFDPSVVRAFLSVSIARLNRIIGPAAALALVPFSIPSSLSRLHAAGASFSRGPLLATGAAMTAGALVIAGIVPHGWLVPSPGSPASPGGRQAKSLAMRPPRVVAVQATSTRKEPVAPRPPGTSGNPRVSVGKGLLASSLVPPRGALGTHSTVGHPEWPMSPPVVRAPGPAPPRSRPQPYVPRSRQGCAIPVPAAAATCGAVVALAQSVAKRALNLG